MRRQAARKQASEVTPEPQGSKVDPTTIRRIMGSFPTGVTIVTSRCADGRPMGLTANAVTSVSLDPPLLLVCLGRSHYSTDVIVKTGAFAVNFLADHQEAVALRFATPGNDKFRNIAVEEGKLGVPLIPHSLAHAECAVTKIIKAGDHLILIGRIVVGQATNGRPLMYFRRQFGAWPAGDQPEPATTNQQMGDEQ